MELEALQEVWPQIKEAGATLVAISPQREQYLHQMAKRHNLTFDILRDKGNEVAAQFGLRFTLPDYLQQLYRKLGADLERFNGDNSWTLPIPARFIILQDSIIAAADADPDYTVRPEPNKTVEALKAMQAK